MLRKLVTASLLSSKNPPQITYLPRIVSSNITRVWFSFSPFNSKCTDLFAAIKYEYSRHSPDHIFSFNNKFSIGLLRTEARLTWLFHFRLRPLDDERPTLLTKTNNKTTKCNGPHKIPLKSQRLTYRRHKSFIYIINLGISLILGCNSDKRHIRSDGNFTGETKN